MVQTELKFELSMEELYKLHGFLLYAEDCDFFKVSYTTVEVMV